MLATVLRERPKWRAAALWLLPWFKTQVRISSRSATGYTFLSLRFLEISFKYSGRLGKVAHFSGSEWPSISIAFTACTISMHQALQRPTSFQRNSHDGLMTHPCQPPLPESGLLRHFALSTVPC